jgi:hypothetical protein
VYTGKTYACLTTVIDVGEWSASLSGGFIPVPADHSRATMD